MTAIDTVDLFAGPGGWSVATAILGLREVGFELDPWACATRAAAGHLTVRADVAAMPTARMKGLLKGLIASPPCGTFSAAGKGEGVGDLPLLHQALDDLAAGRDTREQLAASCSDPRTPLVVEPLRYALDLRPEWIALEQVPAVLPLWRHIARILRTIGYSAWAGILNAADYGVIATCPLHATQSPTASANSAEIHSRYVTALGCAEALATTWPDAALAPLAATVADLLASRIKPAFAGSATCVEREQILAALAANADPTTPCGVEVASWTAEATSRFELTAATAESIASLLSSCLVDPSLARKWSTTSTETRRTIVQRTSRCIAATLITGCGTGPATRAAGCGLCVDAAVPQTRQRAILVASRVRTVAPPEPTHAKVAEPATLFGPTRERWVSMAEALGWDGHLAAGVVNTRGERATPGGNEFSPSGPSWALTEKTRSWKVVVGAGGFASGYERGIDDPLPTIRHQTESWVLRSGQSVGGAGRAERNLHQPAVSITGRADLCSWSLRNNTQANSARRSLAEPAGTLFFGARGNDVSWIGPDDGPIRIAIEEAAVLQSFPPDYPWQGTKTQKFLQIGNAVPPLLALHVLSAATGIPLERAT